MERLLKAMTLFLLALILTGSVTTSSESSRELFSSKLDSILRARIPPYAVLKPDQNCRIVFMSRSPAAIEITLPVHKAQVQTIELLQSRQVMSASVQIFKYSPLCVHILVDTITAAEVPPNRNWVNAHILNMKQIAVHYVLIGPKEDLLQFISTAAYDMLKYKTALTSDTGEVIAGDTGKYDIVHDTVPVLPSEAQLLNGRRMHVLLWRLEPYVSLDENGNVVGGFNYRQAQDFCRIYNVTWSYDVKLKPFNRLANGSWIGFMYNMTEGESDALMGIGITAPRYGSVDFTLSAVSFECGFITSHPRSTVKWQALFYPFDTGVWIAILVFLVGLFPLYFYHFRYSLSYEPLNFSESLYQSISIPFGLLMQECIPIPKHAKLLTVFFMLYSLLITNYYNSNLISFLTFPELDHLPTTFQELADARHKFNIGVMHNPGAIITVYFSETSNPNGARLREVFEWNRDWVDCTKKALFDYKGVCVAITFAYKMISIRNYTLYSNFKPYVEAKDIIFNIPLALATTWNSRYYTAWNRNSVWLFNTGHIVKWMEDGMNYAYGKSRPWMREQMALKTDLARNLTRVMEEADTSSLKPFTVKNFVLSFASLFAGTVLGLFAMAVEGLLHVKNLCKRRNLRRSTAWG